MTETEFQILRSAGFLAAVAIALALQRLAPHARLRGSWRVNATFWIVDLVVLAAACGACACTVSRWAAQHRLGLLNAVPAPPWVAIPVTVLVLDLVSYAWHRANHTVGFLWRFHQVHHSDTAFTVSTAARFHPGELLLSLPLRLAAVALVGAPVAGVITFEIVFGLANFVEHGDIDLPRPLERRLAPILVVPALHRRHHGDERGLLGTNFGTIFILWDRLLGTHGDARSESRVRTGLPGQRGPLGLGAALALPLRPLAWSPRRA